MDWQASAWQLHAWIWGREPESFSPAGALLVRSARLLHVLGQEVVAGRIGLWATGLVYTTLLSLVPLLAVSFSVLKGFGVHKKLEPMLQGVLQPLGAQGTELAQKAVAFVEGVDVGVLGGLGVALLIYSAVSLLRKVEAAFNALWHVHEKRTLSQRLSGYLTVIVVGPLLVVTALGITGTLMSSAVVQAIVATKPFGALFHAGAKVVPYVLVAAAFSFLYIMIPNTRVQLRSALIGGIAAGIVWEAGGWIFASFAAGSTRHTIIYSSFAIGIVFLIWLFLSWFVLLLGARLTYFLQHPESIQDPTKPERLSPRLREHMALLVMAFVVRAYLAPEPKGWTLAELARWLGVPLEHVQPVIGDLHQAGLLIATDEEPLAYVPGRPPDRIALREVLIGVRTSGGQEAFPPQRLPADERVDAHQRALQEAGQTALADATLLDLAADKRG